MKAVHRWFVSFQTLREELSAIGDTEDRMARREAYRKAYTEVVASAQANFAKELETFLTKEQSNKTVVELGSSSTRGALMYHANPGLGEKQVKPLPLRLPNVVVSWGSK